jgi:hypothetical protein
MFEEEEGIWTGGREAWKLSVAYSWPGANATSYLVITISYPIVTIIVFNGKMKGSQVC